MRRVFYFLSDQEGKDFVDETRNLVPEDMRGYTNFFYDEKSCMAILETTDAFGPASLLFVQEIESKKGK